MKEADKSKRALNYFIDSFLIYLIYYIINFIVYFINEDLLANKIWPYMIVVYFMMYYIIFESLYQKTPGKIITKTRVITTKGLKPKFWNILIRTIVRFSPFDMLSYIFGMGKGQHDYFSKTLVVEDAGVEG